MFASLEEKISRNDASQALCKITLPRAEFTLFALLLCDIFCSGISYYTVGATATVWIHLFYVCSIFLVIFAYIKPEAGRFAIVSVLFATFFTLPFALRDSLTLYIKGSEANRVVALLSEMLKNNQPLPKTANDIPRRQEDGLFDYELFFDQMGYEPTADGFYLSYSVTTRSTSYRYWSSKGWIYEDD